MNPNLYKTSLWMSVLSSTSTLFCCVIPAILVLLGAGSAVATLVGAFPQLIWLSEHKAWLFGFGAVMLGLSGFWGRATQNTCPTDPILAKRCRRSKVITKVVWWGSFVLYGIGVVVSYVLPAFWVG